MGAERHRGGPGLRHALDPPEHAVLGHEPVQRDVRLRRGKPRRHPPAGQQRRGGARLPGRGCRGKHRAHVHVLRQRQHVSGLVAACRTIEHHRPPQGDGRHHQRDGDALSGRRRRASSPLKFSKSPRTVTLKSRRPVTLSWINLPVRSRRRVTLTWANLPIRAKVLVVVAIPLCALLASAVAYYVNDRVNIQAEQWVGHAQDVRADIQETLIFLLDAETGMRGYLLTGQDLFLRRYEKAAQALPTDVAALKRLVQDQPTQIARMRRMASLVQEQLRTLAAFRPSPTLAGTAAVRQDALILQSAGIMDAVRREVDGMLTEENRLLAERERQNADAHQGILIAIGLSLLVGLSSGIMASILFAGAVGGRVRRLEENAGQLARGLPLSPWSSGNDEIGHLAEALGRSSVLLADREREMRRAMDLAETAREEADR
ncbi:MAG: hypothetical protein E6H03_02760, partial [Bacillati bacterium ANGP1]